MRAAYREKRAALGGRIWNIRGYGGKTVVFFV
jgi:hypothetical protein